MVYVEQDTREPVIADRRPERWPTHEPRRHSAFVRWFVVGGVCAVAVFVVLVVLGWNMISDLLASASL
jgi:hypothetical protein